MKRHFLQNVTVFSAAVLAGSNLLEGCSPSNEMQSTATIAPPPADSTAAGSSATLSEALKNRKSTNAFKADPLPKEKFLDLLWAAWGINRPDSGKRTAPSAMNTQEIDLYGQAVGYSDE